jgi:hypothetical protein
MLRGIMATCRRRYFIFIRGEALRVEEVRDQVKAITSA